jgi:hypothetical protein
MSAGLLCRRTQSFYDYEGRGAEPKPQNAIFMIFTVILYGSEAQYKVNFHDERFIFVNSECLSLLIVQVKKIKFTCWLLNY